MHIRAVEAMVGQKFGHLTVTSHHSRSKGYNCICDCGNKTIVRTTSLKSGRQFSCGCAPRRVALGHRAAKNSIAKNYKQSALRRGHEYSLTFEELEKLISGNCYYCNNTPTLKVALPRHSDFTYIGIDRIDNSIGYVYANCVSCCFICNRAKYILSQEEFLNWIKRLVNFQKEKNE